MEDKPARRPAERPDEILDAALAEFAEKGFAAARVEDVAARAGLSKGAVYLYFDSKQAMLKELVRRSVGRVALTVERAAEAGASDPEAGLRQALRLVAAAMSDPAVASAVHVVLAEARNFPDIAQFYREEVIEVGRRAIARLSAAGVARGVFRPVDPDAALRAGAGPMLAHMLLTHVFARPGEAPPDPTATADAVADILLEGLKPREGA